MDKITWRRKKIQKKTAIGPADYAKDGVCSFKAYVGKFPPHWPCPFIEMVEAPPGRHTGHRSHYCTVLALLLAMEKETVNVLCT